MVLDVGLEATALVSEATLVSELTLATYSCNIRAYSCNLRASWCQECVLDGVTYLRACIYVCIHPYVWGMYLCMYTYVSNRACITLCGWCVQGPVWRKTTL